MTDLINPELAEYKVICETENCGNFGIEILIMGNALTPFVICGVCGEKIKSVKLNGTAKGVKTTTASGKKGKIPTEEIAAI